MNDWIKDEQNKYNELYSVRNYPPGDVNRITKLLTINSNTKICDLGCGHAFNSRNSPNYYGVDISDFIINKNKTIFPNSNFICSSIDNLSTIYDINFDYVICADVLEHIPPTEIDNVLNEISKLKSRYFYLGISCRDSVWRDVDGGSLHLTIMKPEQWHKKLSTKFTICDMNIMGSFVIFKCTLLPVIAVGNGSSLLDNTFGDIIDQYDDVVRFNAYYIDRFEKNVGTKTNIWYNTVNYTNAKNTPMDRLYKEITIHSWEWDETKDKLYNSFIENYKNSHQFIRKTKKRTLLDMCAFLEIPYYNFSTGAIAIWEISKYRKVDIVGFDWWNTTVHHYGDNAIRGTLHNPSTEKQFIDKLCNEGNVSLLDQTQR